MQGKVVIKFLLKDGREIIFRYPKEGDAPLMLDYINTLSKERTFIRFQGEQLTLEEETDFVKGLLEDIEKKKAIQILAFCGPELIAVSDIKPNKGAIKHVGMFGITVAKDFRNLGIGKKLMQTVLNEVSKNLPGIKIIILSVFSDNPIAQKMYADFGFQQYGSLPEGVMHKNHFDDHIYMYKRV